MTADESHSRMQRLGGWAVRSGAIPAAIGLWFVARVWYGVDPGVSAIMVYLMAFAAGGMFVQSGEEDDR